jgi:hypothetical protein
MKKINKTLSALIAIKTFAEFVSPRVMKGYHAKKIITLRSKLM